MYSLISPFFPITIYLHLLFVSSLNLEEVAIESRIPENRAIVSDCGYSRYLLTPGCVHANFFCGNGVSETILRTFYDCYDFCHSRSECEWFGWHEDHKRCVTFRDCVGMVFRDRWTAVKRECPKFGFGCLYDNTKALAERAVVGRVNDVYECQKKCQEMSICEAFSMRKHDGNCILSDFFKFVIFGVRDETFISGPKFCDSTNYSRLRL